jgi:hypothetical protein
MTHQNTTKDLLVKICYKNNVGVTTTTTKKSISRSPEMFFHIQVLVIYSFATPPIKLKRIGGG